VDGFSVACEGKMNFNFSTFFYFAFAGYGKFFFISTFTFLTEALPESKIVWLLRSLRRQSRKIVPKNEKEEFQTKRGDLSNIKYIVIIYI